MKKIRLITKIIAIIIIILIGFIGVYLPWKNPINMNNEIKDFSLGKDFTGYREIILTISDANKVLDSDKKVVGDTDSYDDSSIKSNNYTKSDEKVNSSDSLNIENYEKSKGIVEKRLNDMRVQEYNLSMDKETGKIYIQITENSITDKVVSNINEIGSVELKDSKDSSKVFLTSENLKEAKVMYGSSDTGTAVYLEMQFDNEGKKILKDLSENEYKKIEETEDSENKEETKTEEDKKEENKEEKEEQKEVTIYMSGNETTTTSFEEAVTDGKISLRMGQSTTDTASIQESVTSARMVATILNNGVMPLKYKVTENQYIESEIKTSTIRNILIVIGVIFVVLLVLMAIKYKKKGILAALCYIAFTSIYLVLLRIFNVTIAMEGFVGGVIILALNYLINLKLIKIEHNNKEYYNEFLDIIMKLIPIFVLSIMFVFIPITALSSIGMVMFWGIILILTYNVAITKHIID